MKKKSAPIEIEKRKIPIIAAILIVVIGFVFFRSNPGLLANFVLISMLVGVMPFVVISYIEYQRISRIEEQFPVFLRDLSESQKSGMSLAEAFRVASRTDYGTLSREIKKINDQLSWGTPLQDALTMFSDRMKGSPLTRRVIRIIIEAYSSGGDIAETMESISADVAMLREAEKERKSIMAQHATMLYMIYFIFIIIILVLSKVLIPMLEIGSSQSSQAAGFIGGFKDPCAICVNSRNILCGSCSTFSLVSSMFGLGTGSGAYYKALFFSLVLVQGLFSGLIIGQIQNNSVLSGARHSILMVAAGFSIFMISVFLGFI